MGNKGCRWFSKGMQIPCENLPAGWITAQGAAVHSFLLLWSGSGSASLQDNRGAGVGGGTGLQSFGPDILNAHLVLGEVLSLDPPSAPEG